MMPGVLDTNKFTDTQSPTDATGLDSFMDIDILVLQGCLFAFPFRQAAHTGKVQLGKHFCRTPLVAMV